MSIIHFMNHNLYDPNLLILIKSYYSRSVTIAIMLAKIARPQMNAYTDSLTIFLIENINENSSVEEIKHELMRGIYGDRLTRRLPPYFHRRHRAQVIEILEEFKNN